MTIGTAGVAAGYKCTLSFTLEGTVYHECTSVLFQHGVAWYKSRLELLLSAALSQSLASFCQHLDGSTFALGTNRLTLSNL